MSPQPGGPTNDSLACFEIPNEEERYWGGGEQIKVSPCLPLGNSNQVLFFFKAGKPRHQYPDCKRHQQAPRSSRPSPRAHPECQSQEGASPTCHRMPRGPHQHGDQGPNTSPASRDGCKGCNKGTGVRGLHVLSSGHRGSIRLTTVASR